MGFFSKLLVGGIVTGLGCKLFSNYAKDKETRKIEVEYNNELSKKEFQEIVKRVAKKIKRINSVTIDNARIEGKVISQSGVSDWYFIADFNDWGYIDGRYIIESDNYDSEIPERFAELVKEEINKIYEEKNANINNVIKKADKKESEY